MSDFKLPPFSVDMQMLTLSETMDWSLSLYGIPEVWKRTKGRGIKVAILDTGIDKRHFEVGDLKNSVVALRDFTGSQVGYFDLVGHGTHTAGTIGARQDDNGVVGVMPECEEIITKVLGDDGSGSGDGVRDGVLWSASAGANIISMSLGSANPDPRIYEALLEVVDAGVTVICAAGNEGPIAGIDTVGYPARWPQAISVGAVDDQGRPASFSSRGPEIDICAPGVNVLSTYRNGGYAKLSGTSMATPFVSGVVGLLLSTGVKLSPASVKLMLRNSAKKWKPGENQDSGVGLIDPGVLLTPLEEPKLPDSPNIVPVGPFRISVEKIGERSGLFITIS